MPKLVLLMRALAIAALLLFTLRCRADTNSIHISPSNQVPRPTETNAAILPLTGAHSEQPLEKRVGETNALPTQIIVDGVTYEDVRWGNVSAARVSIRHKTGAASFPLEKLPKNLQERFGYNPELAAKERAELAKQRARQEQAQRLRKYEPMYNGSKRWVMVGDKYLAYYQTEDRQFIESQDRFHQEFIKAYDEHQEQRLEELYNTITKNSGEYFEQRTPVGFSYNELVKDEVANPITFSLFRNSDNCYIGVGDGNFSVLNEPTGDNILDFFNGIEKAFEWREQCYKEKLEVDKEVGTWGGLSLRLVSTDKGNWAYVWLTVIGEPGGEHLLEKKTVRVDMLNLSCLYYKISHVQQMIDKREREKKNADRLK